MKHKLAVALLCALIFTVPSNLFLKFFETRAYANGIFVDYLIPKLYLSDFFIVPLLLLWLIELYEQKKLSLQKVVSKQNVLIVILVTALLIKQFFTTRTVAALWYTAKLCEMNLLTIWLWQHKKLLQEKTVVLAIIATIVFQSIVGILQFRNQQSVGGYWLLGESNLSVPFGLATINLGGELKVSAYGTTAHPNILAGVLAAYLLTMIFSFKPSNKYLGILKIAALTAGLIALVDTGSVSGLLMFGIGLLVLSQRFDQKKLLLLSTTIFLLMPAALFVLNKLFPDNMSIYRRVALNWRALKMFKENFWLGIGLNQFTTAPFSTASKELTRFVQPAHHLGMVWLAETGVAGVALLAMLVQKIEWKKLAIPFAVLIPAAALDHYLLTQQTGLLLTAFALTYFSERK